MYSVEQPLSGSPRGAVAHSIHSFITDSAVVHQYMYREGLSPPGRPSTRILPDFPILPNSVLRPACSKERSKDLKDSLAWQFGNGMLIAPISSGSKRKGA